MLHFTQLRLHGFKSFVERTELDIGPGMTGIVGPNGCGKSNLVEALRWVMGETSAKRMRGSEMNDVIFGGTALRPGRNVAEVSLVLDNSKRGATAEFNDADTLEITRQIERDAGSDYRVNSRPVRQRDVQLLFADLATGAHATSLVSQGQIDALIRAKPQDRRQILEEASGTAGLQARRHEAELKLKAAEQNLTRVDDVLNALDAQLRGLKTQVRQASRYRNLADHIRRAEAALAHLRWVAGQQQSSNSREALTAAEAAVNEFLAIVTRGAAERTQAAAELPPLRQAEAAAAAVVQRLILAREQVEAELRQVAQETARQEERRAQAIQDRVREEHLREDALAATAKLDTENAELEARLEAIAVELPAANAALDEATAAVEGLDGLLGTLTQNIAEYETKHAALTRRIAELEDRRAKFQERREEFVRQRAALTAENASRPDLALALAMIDACEQEMEKRQASVAHSETEQSTAEERHKADLEIRRDADAKLTKSKAEAEAIRTVMRDAADEQILDLVEVAPGLETALVAALGEALAAPLDERAATHWLVLPPMENAPPLPHGAEPLTGHIKAPQALDRALTQIGLVQNAEIGRRMVELLAPGQILVSRDGWAWRWDGFTVTPTAPTAAAVRLQQRNRLTALQTEIAEAEAAFGAAQTAAQESGRIFTERQQQASTARQALQQAYAALDDARRHHARHAEAAAAAQSKLTALDDALSHLDQDDAALAEQAGQAQTEITALPDTASMRREQENLRLQLAEKRQAQIERRSKRDHAAREQESAAARQKHIAGESAGWRNRTESAAAQIQTLAERIGELDSSLASLRDRPVELDAKRGELLTQGGEAEAARRDAADALIAAENHLAAIEQQLKRDETALTEARENRVRAEGAVEAADEHLRVLAAGIAEKLSCAPEGALELAELEADAPLPEQSGLEQQLARHVRERDNMGPVNLRAEIEAETVEADMTKLQTEKDDLVAAIAKLRQAIGQLNKEARDRLIEAFQKVDERFQVLFKRLFNGGRAHLQLIDDEDPLNAGLEIFASPPGKKLQILSLLSGGERSLTALALLFAVFQTNPSPICVLDEAEAALDESNIDRFCSLVADIARETSTRFLIITHQRMTMARMDRLFGVTMSEKGVSQLVSVDLNQAEAIRDGEIPHDLTLAAAE
ncbi:MAG: chromosome segregation protein SMC [Alphaproteobacteria bacterium]